MTIKASSLVGGSMVRLAPDLLRPSSVVPNFDYAQTPTVDCSGGMTSVLSLSGKFALGYLKVGNVFTYEQISIRLTIDGVVIWDDTLDITAQNLTLIGTSYGREWVLCNESLLLEVQTLTDTSISAQYLARPIL